MIKNKTMAIISIMSLLNVNQLSQAKIVLKSKKLHQKRAKANTLDATAEINQLAKPVTNPVQPQCHTQNNHSNQSHDNLEAAVLSNFAHIVQNFFNIVQSPGSVQVVGTNIAQMLSGLVNVAIEAMKRVPEDITQEERAKYLELLEDTLKKNIRSLTKFKNHVLEQENLK